MVYKLADNRVRRTYTGGRHIDRLLGRTPARDTFYPEEWVASTVCPAAGAREGLSRTAGGDILADLIAAAPMPVLGPAQAEKHGSSLSILVKLLDAAERLVVQAHPTRAFALRHYGSPYGKAECWYVLDAAKDAHVYLGFREGITRAAWRDVIDRQDIPAMLSLLHRIPVEPGDFLYVDGGVPHAIGAGCFLLELQEPTDRMVVAERMTPGGRPIPTERLYGGLDYEAMLDCYVYDGMSEHTLRQRYVRRPELRPDARCGIIGPPDTDKFAMEAYDVRTRLAADYGDRYAAAVVLAGSGALETASGTYPLAQGDRLFLPAADADTVWRGTLRAVVCLPV